MKTATVVSWNVAAGMIQVLAGSLIICASVALALSSYKPDRSFWAGAGAALINIPFGLYIAFQGIGFFFKARSLKRKGESPSRLQTAEDRLDELERLKRRDMITPEEYTAKRQEILKDL